MCLHLSDSCSYMCIGDSRTSSSQQYDFGNYMHNTCHAHHDPESVNIEFDIIMHDMSILLYTMHLQRIQQGKYGTT